MKRGSWWLTTLSTPTQRSSGPSSSAASAGTQATGSAVTGLVAPGRLTSRPARALSRLDLPAPVPPARAHTNAVPGKPSRVLAAPRVSRAGPASSPSCSAASATRSSASRQPPRSLFIGALGFPEPLGD